MKWNGPKDVPIPEYEDLLFVYEAERYNTEIKEVETVRAWAKGAYSPMDCQINLVWGGFLYRDEVLYWARVEMPKDPAPYGPNDYPNSNELYEDDDWNNQAEHHDYYD